MTTDFPHKGPGPCITNVFATCRKNFSQWHHSFQRKLRSHWLKFLRHVAITLVIQGPAMWKAFFMSHYNDVLMGMMASQITSLPTGYSTFYSGGDQRKHQSSVSLAFVQGIHRWPVNSPHKGPVRLKMFPFDDVIMIISWYVYCIQ